MCTCTLYVDVYTDVHVPAQLIICSVDKLELIKGHSNGLKHGLDDKLIVLDSVLK